MRERPSFFDELGAHLLAGQQRQQRQRNARRVLLAAAACVLIGGTSIYFLRADEPRDLVTAQTTEDTVVAPVTTTPPVTTTQLQPPSAPTAEPDVVAPTAAPAAAQEASQLAHIIWSEAGLELVESDGTATQITTEAISMAVLFDTGVIVYQVESEQLIVRDSAGIETVVQPDADKTLRLLGGGVVSLRPVVFVESATTRPANPSQAEDELVLLDVESGTRTGFGPGPGWEHRINAARAGSDAIVLMVADGIINTLEVRNFDGTIRFAATLTSDSSPVVAIRPGGREVTVLDQYSPPDLFAPGLALTTYDLTTGNIVDQTQGMLTLQNVQVEFGYCAFAEYTPDGNLICDVSFGAPVRIEPGVSWKTMAINGLEAGTLSYELPTTES